MGIPLLEFLRNQRFFKLKLLGFHCKYEHAKNKKNWSLFHYNFHENFSYFFYFKIKNTNFPVRLGSLKLLHF